MLYLGGAGSGQWEWGKGETKKGRTGSKARTHAWAATSVSTNYLHEWHMLQQMVQQVSFLETLFGKKGPWAISMTEEGKEFDLHVHFLSPVLFAWFYTMGIMVLGSKMAFSGPMDCQVPCRTMARGAWNSLPVCGTAAKELAPLVLQEVTGHSQSEKPGG